VFVIVVFITLIWLGDCSGTVTKAAIIPAMIRSIRVATKRIPTL